jgi:hypothetical protein
METLDSVKETRTVSADECLILELAWWNCNDPVFRHYSVRLAFYRALRMDIPPEADGEPHVEVTRRGKLAADCGRQPSRGARPGSVSAGRCHAADHEARTG